MDPKLSNLDPKLQDAYNRVMGNPSAGVGAPPPPQNPDPALPNPFAQNPVGSPTPPQNPYTPPAPAAPPPPPQPAYTPPPPPAPEPAPAPPLPPAPEPVAPPAPPAPVQNTPAGSIPGVNSTVAFNAADSGKNVGTTPVKKGGLHMMPVLIGVAIIFLLVAYTFVWIFLFKVQVPFLPSFS